MSLRHVQRGEPLAIPADDWNRIVDATRAYYQEQGSPARKPATVGLRQASVILVKNAGGSDQARFAVLGIDTPIILPADNPDEFKRQVAFSCVTPSAADHRDRFVVLLEPVASGGIGRACISGVTVVRLQVDNETDDVAGIADGDSSRLIAGSRGSAVILWKEANDGPEGTRWAIVRIGSAAAKNPFYAKITGYAGIGSNRWSYSFTEQTYLTGGAWKDTPRGISGAAYNTIEARNSADGVQGNGVDVTNLPTGVDLQPIGIGAVVRIDTVADCDTAQHAYVFQAVNQIDGACSGGIA